VVNVDDVVLSDLTTFYESMPWHRVWEITGWTTCDI